MNLTTIPLKNLRRKPLRTALMTLVFAVGVASVVALANLSKAVGHSLEEKLSAFGANILVAPKKEQLSVTYGGMNLGDVSYGHEDLDMDATMSAIRSIGHAGRIAAVAPKLALPVEVDFRKAGLIGVDWNQELRIKNYWAVDGEFPARPGQILAGSKAAESLGLAPGFRTFINNRPMPVTGVLHETGGDEDSMLFTDIKTAQELAGKPGKAHFVEVAALCSGCPIEEITDQLRKVLPGADVMALQKVVSQRMATISFVKNLALAVSLVILLTGCAMISLSIFTSVNERKGEIGVMRAFGFSGPSVFAAFCFEAIFIGSAAGLVGYAAGLFSSIEILKMLGMDPGAIAFDPVALAATLALVAALAALASAWPALKAARIEPSRALVSL